MTGMPLQPIVQDDLGIYRFRVNRIVLSLLEHGPFDLNDIARGAFEPWEQAPFAQLIGYSVSGFGELSYADPEQVAVADAVVLCAQEGEQDCHAMEGEV